MAKAPTRQMALFTQAGAALEFHAMHAREDVSRPFEFEVLALSDDAALDANALLGTAAKVSLRVGGAPERWFHGIVASFGIDGSVGRRHRYRLVLRPWLWLLSRSTDVRIFQAQHALDIIKVVLADYPANLADETRAARAQREFCVQYRETDLDFVSRLLEEEGISYHFRHSESGHQMVLVDNASGFQPVPGAATIVYSDDPDRPGDFECMHVWQMQHEIQSGRFVLRDFDPLSPGTDLTSAPAKASRSHAESQHEVYDYPGGHRSKAEADKAAERLRDATQSRFARFSGASNVPGLAAGTRFRLKGHPRAALDAEYVVLGTDVELQAGLAESDRGAAAQTRFELRVRAQPLAEPLTPARVTPKPRVGGPQTAIVVGDAGGDILTDEHGRVKVQFHWDRLGKKTADSSCWIRVAMPSAGNGFGLFSLPRIGQEVVVDFLEGDPDRPLITGRVHNAQQKTPYELPAHASVSTFKTRTRKGPASRFNELRFEDADGKEYVLLRSEKDLLQFVKNAVRSQIGESEHRTVKKDRREKIDGEHHVSVGKDARMKVGKKLHLKVDDAMQLETGNKYNLKAAQDLILESGTKVSGKAGTDMHLKIGQNLGADAGMNLHLKGGMNIVIEAGMQVTIKAGPASVVLGPDGVSITGPMVKINSGGSPGSGAGASPSAPAAPEAPEAPELPADPLTHR